MNLNRWEWNNSQGRLTSVSGRSRSGHSCSGHSLGRNYDPVTGDRYDFNSGDRRFHIPIFEALYKEDRKRVEDRNNKGIRAELLVSEWRHEAYQVILSTIIELSNKHCITVPSINQIEEAVGECVQKEDWKGQFHEDSFATYRSWAIRASKLIDPTSRHEVG